MSPVRLPPRPSTLRSICRACRRTIHSTFSRRQDPSSSPPSTASTATPANASPAPQRRADPNADFVGLLNKFRERSESFSANSSTRLANSRISSTRTATATAIGSIAGNRQNNDGLYNFVDTLSSTSRQGLSAGTSRYTKPNGLDESSQVLRDRGTRQNKSLKSHQDDVQQQDLRRRLGRQWRVGDVYAPSDLGPREQRKWLKRQKGQMQGDVFETMGKSPLAFYRNFTVVSEFISETGRIKPASETGLKRKNQRKMAKTIRRAIGLSLIPSVYKHPMILGRKVGILGV